MALFTIKIKPRVKWLAYLFGILFPLCFLHAQSIDEVVLIVNDQAITLNEFKSLVRVQSNQAPGETSAPTEGDPTTETIINDALMLSHIRQIAPNENVERAQIDAAINGLAAQNQLQPQQMLNQLQRDGIDLRVFTNAIKNRLLIQKVISQPLSSRVKVSASEIQEFIQNRPELKAQIQEEYELYHLVVGIENLEDEAEYARVIAIVKEANTKLASGQKFDAVFAQTPGATSGGDNGYLGWRKNTELPELFVWALESMQSGQVSPVLESTNGLHLLKLIAKRNNALTVDEYKIRHILKRVGVDEDPSSAAQTLREVRSALLDGASFSDVAQRESDDRGSAVLGGELGWVQLDSLVPGFANAVVNLAPNTLSQPIRSRFGMHLIEVISQRTVQRESNLVEEQARQQIFAEKVDAKIDDLLSDLRAVAVIEFVQ